MIEIADDIQTLEARIRTAEIEKKALLTAEASAEEITGRDFYIAALTAAKKLLLVQDELQRAEKHRADVYRKWYPLAVDLKEKVEAARQRHERAVMLYPPAEKNVDLIDLALCEHRQNEPRRENFPSAKTVHRWNVRRNHLQEERQRREQSRIEAKTEMENAATDLRKLVDEYQHAANLCRLYQPRDAAAIAAAQPVPVQWTVRSSPPSRVSSL